MTDDIEPGQPPTNSAPAFEASDRFVVVDGHVYAVRPLTSAELEHDCLDPNQPPLIELVAVVEERSSADGG